MNVNKKFLIENTSHIRIRPFICIDEQLHPEKYIDKKEPTAILKFNNIEVEIGYSIIGSLTLDTKDENMILTRVYFKEAIEEIHREMVFELDGEMPKYHRDSEERQKMWKDRNYLTNDEYGHVVITKNNNEK